MRRVLHALLLMSACASVATLRAQTVSVNAASNSVGDGGFIALDVPSGSYDLRIEASGSANYAPSQHFLMLVMEHKEGVSSVRREVPIGQEIVVQIEETAGYPLHFFFVDTDASDNSGYVEVTMSGTIEDVVVVSATEHCLVNVDIRAVSITLPSGPCEAMATGNPGWGGGPFATVTMMFHHADGSRAFQDVQTNGIPVSLPGFLGGVVLLFFTDGVTNDNSGDAIVSFDCAGPVPVELATWSSVRSLYR